MFNYIRRKWMAFKDIFKDDNDINEKNVIGFMSFAVMTLFAFFDLSNWILWKRFSNQRVYLQFIRICNSWLFWYRRVRKICKKVEKD